ncbi:MAG: hypothetical protein ACETV1_04055, partial [Candidatus Bathyarchaeia archaeon]
PLMLPLLGGLYALGYDLVAVMKYLPTLLYGLLGLSAFLFSRLHLKWRVEKSLLVVFLLAVSFPSLRISWDMHKQMMATILLLLALSCLGSIERPLGFTAFTVLSFLTALSHELLFAVEMVVFSYVFLAKTRKEPLKALLVFSVAFFILLAFIGIWYKWNFGLIASLAVGDVLVDTSSLLDKWTWEVSKNLFEFFQLCGLLVPLAFIGFFKHEVLLPWCFLGLLGSFSTVLFPLHAPLFILPSRWMMFLAYPFSFYVANALDRLNLLAADRLERLGTLILVIFTVNLPSWGFLGLVPQLPLYTRPALLPWSMAASSVHVSDVEVAAWFTEEFDKGGEGVLIVHGDYLGWASYYSKRRIVTYGEVYGGGRSVKEALEMALENNQGDVYLLCYVDDEDNVCNLDFVRVGERGLMKLYYYNGSDTG